ncbi:hypothetical protein M426DRAFT_20855 [Hypoxylon sp. CI-4A]|nr:hypothetical protein M426DRAFT_20855 [Hypoxylon sp. CI-4A]
MNRILNSKEFDPGSVSEEFMSLFLMQDLVVRIGGHDFVGRSQVRDALTIDMRDIKYVRISDDEKTAGVGGGILFRNLTKALEKRGLVTPVGWRCLDRRRSQRRQEVDWQNCLMNNSDPKSVTAYCEFNEALVTYEIHTEVSGGAGKVYGVASGRQHRAFPPHAPSAEAESRLRFRVTGGSSHARTGVHDTREGTGAEWSNALLDELWEKDPEKILESSYVSFMGNEDSVRRKIYGSHHDALLALKRKYDPDNVFKFAVPRLLS